LKQNEDRPSAELDNHSDTSIVDLATKGQSYEAGLDDSQTASSAAEVNVILKSVDVNIDGRAQLSIETPFDRPSIVDRQANLLTATESTASSGGDEQCRVPVDDQLQTESVLAVSSLTAPMGSTHRLRKESESSLRNPPEKILGMKAIMEEQ